MASTAPSVSSPPAIHASVVPAPVTGSVSTTGGVPSSGVGSVIVVVVGSSVGRSGSRVGSSTSGPGVGSSVGSVEGVEEGVGVEGDGVEDGDG